MSFDPSTYNDLKVTETAIPGFFEIDLSRAWR